MNTKTKKIVTSALFASIICVATLVIQIPAALGGYVNLGDVFVLLAGFLLGPLYGGMASGIGSCLADVLAYPVYAPATFVIKFAMAFITGVIGNRSKKIHTTVLGAIAAEFIMVVGYLAYGLIIFGEPLTAAIATIPGNAMQAVAGIAGGVILYRLIGNKKI